MKQYQIMIRIYSIPINTASVILNTLREKKIINNANDNSESKQNCNH